jgi:DNA-binding cell septation regulator SpoVG
LKGQQGLEVNKIKGGRKTEASDSIPTIHGTSLQGLTVVKGKSGRLEFFKLDKSRRMQCDISVDLGHPLYGNIRHNVARLTHSVIIILKAFIQYLHSIRITTKQQRKKIRCSDIALLF